MSGSDRLAVVALEGSGRARGEMYGAAARDLIREAASRWRAHVLDKAPTSAAGYLAALVQDTAYRAAVTRYAPDLIDEISGIAYGAGVDEDTIFAINLLDEEWTLRERLSSSGAGHHCTSLGQASAGPAPVLVAQNLDLDAWMDGLQVVLELAPVDDGDEQQPAALVPSLAGMIGTMSLNAHGLGVALNTMAQLPSAADGLPVAFVVRLLARQRDVTSAEALLRALPHASGQNYLLGDPNEVLDVECSGAGAVSITLEASAIAHTNHPLRDHPRPFDDPRADFRGRDFTTKSEERLHHAAQALSHRRLGVDDLKHLLSQPPIRRGDGEDPGHSLFGLVMECSSSPVLHMSAGEPRVDNFTTHHVNSGAQRSTLLHG